MIHLKFNYRNVLSFISDTKIQGYQDEIDQQYKTLFNKTGEGSDFLGWIDLPDNTSEDLIRNIERLA